MHHFNYKNGVLHAEDVDIARLADEIGTPFYCYSSATLTRHYNVFAQAFEGMDAHVFYAMKANSNQAVLHVLARLGAGMDVVSEGEIRRALNAGVSPDRIIFAGVGKWLMWLLAVGPVRRFGLFRLRRQRMWRQGSA